MVCVCGMCVCGVCVWYVCDVCVCVCVLFYATFVTYFSLARVCHVVSIAHLSTCLMCTCGMYKNTSRTLFISLPCILIYFGRGLGGNCIMVHIIMLFH